MQQPSLGSKLIAEISDEWMHDGVHIHIAIFLNHKEVGNNAKSSHRKESWDDYLKWSKGDGDRQASYDITSRYNLNRMKMKFFLKETQPHRLRKETTALQHRRLWMREKRAASDSYMHTTIYKVTRTFCVTQVNICNTAWLPTHKKTRKIMYIHLIMYIQRYASQ